MSIEKMGLITGSGLAPHRSIDRAGFALEYAANPARWDKAFEFLRTHDLSTLAPADYPVDGEDAVVKVSFAPAKELGEVKWEAHEKFVDIQLVGAGREKIGVAPIAGAKVVEPYDESRDVAFYETEGTYHLAEPGTYFIFLPGDVHRPGIKVGEEPVRKIVVKIRAAQQRGV